jgi:hypothetical protein
VGGVSRRRTIPRDSPRVVNESISITWDHLDATRVLALFCADCCVNPLFHEKQSPLAGKQSRRRGLQRFGSFASAIFR